jgi:hypothetical protein
MMMDVGLLSIVDCNLKIALLGGYVENACVDLRKDCVQGYPKKTHFQSCTAMSERE